MVEAAFEHIFPFLLFTLTSHLPQVTLYVENQGAKVANLFFDTFYSFMSYPQSAIAN